MSYLRSHTGQEVIFDLFFCFPTVEILDGIGENTDLNGERKGCNLDVHCSPVSVLFYLSIFVLWIRLIYTEVG